jgi:hypothetical protein
MDTYATLYGPYIDKVQNGESQEASDRERFEIKWSSPDRGFGLFVRRYIS